MEKVKVLIQYVMLRKFKNNKNAVEKLRKFVVFIDKISLLTSKFETFIIIIIIIIIMSCR